MDINTGSDGSNEIAALNAESHNQVSRMGFRPGLRSEKGKLSLGRGRVLRLCSGRAGRIGGEFLSRERSLRSCSGCCGCGWIGVENNTVQPAEKNVKARLALLHFRNHFLDSAGQLHQGS